MRTAALFVLVIALGAAIGVGLKQASSDGGTASAYPEALKPSATEVQQKLGGAPAPLAALHAQSNELLGGERAALRERLAQVKGHPAVVNVWASWCGPCRAEMPAFQRLHERWQQQGVRFVGLSSEAPEVSSRFGQELGITYPLWTGGEQVGELSRRLGNHLSVLPHTVIVDPSGAVLEQRVGPYTETELEGRLAELIRKTT